MLFKISSITSHNLATPSVLKAHTVKYYIGHLLFDSPILGKNNVMTQEYS